MRRTALLSLCVIAALGATEVSSHEVPMEADISMLWSEGAERSQVRACHAELSGKTQLFYFIEETSSDETAPALRKAGFRWLDEDGRDGGVGCNGVYDDKGILHFGQYNGGFGISPICESGRQAIEARVKPVRFRGLKGRDVVDLARRNDCGRLQGEPHSH